MGLDWKDFKAVLATQALGSYSEMKFSNAGLICGKKGQMLTPSHVNDLSLLDRHTMRQNDFCKRGK